MNHDKLEFLQNDFIFLLKHLAPDAHGKWGVMNGQQMVEHFIEVVRIASGKTVAPVLNQGEKLEKFRQFIRTDKPFRENTKNPMLSETPASSHYPTMQTAIAELEKEIGYFISVFEKTPEHTTLNPFAGALNFSDNVLLLYKHAIHHLAQFGLREKETPSAE